MTSRFEKSMMAKQRVKEAEQKGLIADSSEIRTFLMNRVHLGESTLEEVQKELKKIQLQAHAKGLYTKDDVYVGRIIDFEMAKYIDKQKQYKKLNKELSVTDKQNKKSKI